jgi:hypothetical protein
LNLEKVVLAETSPMLDAMMPWTLPMSFMHFANFPDEVA